MANTRIDLEAGDDLSPSIYKPFLYAGLTLGPDSSSAVAEPAPPDDAGAVPQDPLDRLSHCLGLQEQAIRILETQGFANSKIVSLLIEAIQIGRGVRHDICTLQDDIESLHTRQDLMTVALKRAESLGITDDLTGLPNRRAFLQRLDQEIGRSLRTGEPLSVALLDLDNFKEINDRFGHQVGDRVLHAVAQRLAREFRRYDLTARYGGEEFVLMFPVTRPEEAYNALEKLRRQVRQEPIDVEIGGIPLELPTFSAGIAGFHPGEASTSLLNRADQALYRAKNLGRNRTECDNSSPGSPSPETAIR